MVGWPAVLWVLDALWSFPWKKYDGPSKALQRMKKVDFSKLEKTTVQKLSNMSLAQDPESISIPILSDNQFFTVSCSSCES